MGLRSDLYVIRDLTSHSLTRRPDDGIQPTELYSPVFMRQLFVPPTRRHPPTCFRTPLYVRPFSLARAPLHKSTRWTVHTPVKAGVVGREHPLGRFDPRRHFVVGSTDEASPTLLDVLDAERRELLLARFTQLLHLRTRPLLRLPLLAPRCALCQLLLALRVDRPPTSRRCRACSSAR